MSLGDGSSMLPWSKSPLWWFWAWPSIIYRSDLGPAWPWGLRATLQVKVPEFLGASG